YRARSRILEVASKMAARQDFKRVARDYFPRWHAWPRWRITTHPRRSSQGFCDDVRKVIEIRVARDDADEFDAVMIHEICHAVTSGDHGKAWQHRMLQAADRAEKLGRPRLAKLLRDQIEKIRTIGFRITASDTYQQIHDAVFDQPNAKFRQVVAWI